jgi:hypothetical protein
VNTPPLGILACTTHQVLLRIHTRFPQQCHALIYRFVCMTSPFNLSLTYLTLIVALDLRMQPPLFFSEMAQSNLHEVHLQVVYTTTGISFLELPNPPWFQPVKGSFADVALWMGLSKTEEECCLPTTKNNLKIARTTVQRIILHGTTLLETTTGRTKRI